MGEVGCLNDGSFQNLECVRLNGGTAAGSMAVVQATNGVAATIIANSNEAADVLTITANTLTSGRALLVSSSSDANTTGGLVVISDSAAASSQAAPTLRVSTTATTNAAAGAASFTGNSITLGDAVAISADSITTGSALKITAEDERCALRIVKGNLHLQAGGLVRKAAVVNGGKTLSAAELLTGVIYNGAAGGSVAFTFPTASNVVTALTAMGVTAAAGVMLPPIPVYVTDAYNLTITGASGSTVVANTNDVITQKEPAIIYYVFTSGSAADIIVIRTAA